MAPEQAVDLARFTMETVLWIAAPVLIAATIVSLLVNIVQVLTSIQDVTIATVPRLAAVVGAVILLSPWMLRRLIAFTSQLFSDFQPYVR